MSRLCGGSVTRDFTEHDAEGFVLAGGQSRRMGRDKALVPLRGRPLVEYAVGVLREAGLPVYLAGGQPSLVAYAPLVGDAQSGLGPLSGVCAALAANSKQWAVLVPVDLPLLPASLIICLLRHARITDRAVTISSINGFPQTFPTVLKREVLPVLQLELETGRGGCFSGFQAAAASRGEPLSAIPVEMLVQAGQAAHPAALPAARWFFNVNSEQDLRRAEAHFHMATR